MGITELPHLKGEWHWVSWVHQFGDGNGVRVSGGDQAEPCLDSRQNAYAEGSNPDPAAGVF